MGQYGKQEEADDDDADPCPRYGAQPRQSPGGGDGEGNQGQVRAALVHQDVERHKRCRQQGGADPDPEEYVSPEPGAPEGYAGRGNGDYEQCRADDRRGQAVRRHEGGIHAASNGPEEQAQVVGGCLGLRHQLRADVAGRCCQGPGQEPCPPETRQVDEGESGQRRMPQQQRPRPSRWVCQIPAQQQDGKHDGRGLRPQSRRRCQPACAAEPPLPAIGGEPEP